MADTRVALVDVHSLPADTWVVLLVGMHRWVAIEHFVAGPFADQDTCARFRNGEWSAGWGIDPDAWDALSSASPT